jgi:hypothetical protein
VSCIDPLVAWAVRLDKVIVAVGRAFWRAVIDGYAAYGETLCTPVPASNSRTDNDSCEPHEEVAVPSSLCPGNDQRVGQEHEHTEDLLESMRHR